MQAERRMSLESRDGGYAMVPSQQPPSSFDESRDPYPSRESVDTKEDEVNPNHVFDIDPDAYGAAMLAFTLDLPKMMMRSTSRKDRQFHLVQVLFAAALILMNLFMQGLMVYFVHHHVVLPKVNEIQAVYRKFHAEAFDASGNFDEALWRTFPYETRRAVCEVGPSQALFYRVTMFIWVITMMKEFRRCVDLIVNIFKVPSTRDMATMLIDKKVDGQRKTFIVKLTTPIRVLMYVAIIIPKSFLAFMLLVQGMRWLTATTKFEDLVMNAVAMIFVLRVDDTLFNAFLPKKRQDEVEEIDFWIPTDEPHQNDEEGHRRRLRYGYRNSAICFLTTLSIVFVYTRFLQTVLPSDLQDIRNACADIQQIDQSNRCPDISVIPTFTRAFNTFRGIKSKDCFPLGANFDPSRLQEL